MKKGDKYDVGYIDKVRAGSDHRNMANGLCSLCHIIGASSMHHLIPKSMSTQKGKPKDLIPLCKPCHAFIHKAFSHRELATKLNTTNKLLGEPLVNQFVMFVEKHQIKKKTKVRNIVIQDGLVFLKVGYEKYDTAYGR